MSSPGFTPLGESSRLVPAKSPAVFEILPPPGSTLNKDDCVASVLSPSKNKVNAFITREAANGAMRIEFVPNEVGTHVSSIKIFNHRTEQVAHMMMKFAIDYRSIDWRSKISRWTTYSKSI